MGEGTSRKRKNYPGNPRELGSRDYGIILSKLIGLKNDLINLKPDQEMKIGDLYHKLSTKLIELGFKRQGAKVKKLVGRRKGGQYSFVKVSKKEEVMALVADCWREGKKNHDNKREENAKKKKDNS